MDWRATPCPGSTKRRFPATINIFRPTFLSRSSPTTRRQKVPQEESAFRCVVLELLDPAKHLGDEFDGIFCKTRKGKYDINLPLIELELPDDSRNFQLIEDYWFWFWNWL